MIGAIAAGCTAVIKPSEIAPHYAAVLAKLIPLYLDTSAYRIVCGAVPEITKLLELQCMYSLCFLLGNVDPIELFTGDHSEYSSVIYVP